MPMVSWSLLSVLSVPVPTGLANGRFVPFRLLPLVYVFAALYMQEAPTSAQHVFVYADL